MCDFGVLCIVVPFFYYIRILKSFIETSGTLTTMFLNCTTIRYVLSFASLLEQIFGFRVNSHLAHQAQD